MRAEMISRGSSALQGAGTWAGAVAGSPNLWPEAGPGRSPAGLSCWIVPASPEPAGTCAIKRLLNLCQHVNKALFMCKALGKQL